MGRDADVKLAIHQAQAQARLDEEQRGILSRLEAKNHGAVSEFVRDWRLAHPTATAEKLQELRVIEQKIDNDVQAAASFTRAARQQRVDKLSGMARGVFGDVEVEAGPGL